MYCRNCGAELNAQADYCVKCGVKKGTGRSFCPSCGEPTLPQAVVCVKCGVSLTGSQCDPTVSERNGLVALLLCLFLGELGAHSFYCGKIGIGVAQLLTLGGCGVWALVDLILICCGTYRDKEGRYVKISV